MQNKGLCSTCLSDGTCSFLRKFPVIMCEEFDIMAINLKKQDAKEPNLKEKGREITTYEE